MSAFACFREKALIGKPAKITFLEKGCCLERALSVHMELSILNLLHVSFIVKVVQVAFFSK